MVFLDPVISLTPMVLTDADCFRPSPGWYELPCADLIKRPLPNKPPPIFFRLEKTQMCYF